MIELFQSKPCTAKPAPLDDLEKLRSVVEALSFPRVFGTSENERARTLICKEFRSIFGEEPKVTGDSKNVVMGDPRKASILVGAHYDSVPGTPGADDNASAVACMLRIAAKAPPSDQFCFVAFNGEECGLKGSDEFATDLLQSNRSPRLKEVHVLEMVGFRSYKPNSQKNPLGPFGDQLPTVGDFIGFVTNHARFCQKIMAHADSIAVPVVGACIPLNVQNMEQARHAVSHLFRSDHASFWQFEVPAVMWTDTAEFRNPNYHQKTDTPDTLDYEFTAAVSDLILRIIADSA